MYFTSKLERLTLSIRTCRPHNRNMATAFTDPSAQLDFPAFRPEMAFPPLTDAMIETIRDYASEVTEPAGITIFARGERGTDMFVVLDGNVTSTLATKRTRAKP